MPDQAVPWASLGEAIALQTIGTDIITFLPCIFGVFLLIRICQQISDILDSANDIDTLRDTPAKPPPSQ